MKTNGPVKLPSVADLHDIEETIDSANLLSMELAIQSFETDAGEGAVFGIDGKSFKAVAERGLLVTGMIGRMLEGCGCRG